MRFSGVTLGLSATFALVVLSLTGCAATNTTHGSPNARHVDSASLPADPSANAAALDFASYYQGADARHCGRIDSSLDGVVSNRIWDTYSCRNVMSPADVKEGCHYGAGSAGGGPHAKISTLSRHPLVERFTNVTWGTSDLCPGRTTQTVGGTYDVTVTKTPDGWIVTGFTTLTGPRP